MLNHSRKYTILIGAIGVIVTLEALTNGLKKEEYCYLRSREPDIPTENFIPSPLPHTEIAVVGSTSVSGDVINL